MRKQDLNEDDANFKIMAQEDETELQDNRFDFDATGKFLKGEDGYSLAQEVDFHDLNGEVHDKPVPRIIGKTSPKTEHFTEGHPANKESLSIIQKVNKQLKALTDIMDLDEAGRKHWFYRLRREYIKEAKIKKRLE